MANVDFITYNDENTHEIVFGLPGDEKIKPMVADAKDLDGFIRFHVTEMGPLSKADGVWFNLSVMFTNKASATWFKLKWA
jgi:hypothetical protein